MTNKVWNYNIQRSCPVLYFHFVFGLCLIILGWTAVASRWIPKIKPYHRLMGQIWTYGMIIQVYFATYVSFNGYAWFVFMFGLLCYGGLIAGHSFIRKLQRNRYERCTQSIATESAKELQAIGAKSDDSEQEEDVGTINTNSANDAISSNVDKDASKASTCWTQQVLKRAHAVSMILSLIMLTGAGAAFSIRWASTQTCMNIYCDGDADGTLPTCFN